MIASSADDRTRFSLTCDQCGHGLAGVDDADLGWEHVWALVAEHGWEGVPSATGPHRCPRCAPAASLAAGPLHEVHDPHPHAGLRVATSRCDVAAIVDLDGDLDVLVADTLGRTLAVAARDRRHVIVDLAGVRLVDSTALGLLVRTHHAARRRGGMVCLVAPSLFVLALLDTMHLDQIFPVFASTDQALDWLAAGPP